MTLHLISTKAIDCELSLKVVLITLKKPSNFDKDLRIIGLKRLTQWIAFLVALTSARCASKICAIICGDIRFSASEAVLHLDHGVLPKMVLSGM